MLKVVMARRRRLKKVGDLETHKCYFIRTDNWEEKC
jgi:hypothetical protein